MRTVLSHVHLRTGARGALFSRTVPRIARSARQMGSPPVGRIGNPSDSSCWAPPTEAEFSDCRTDWQSVPLLVLAASASGGPTPPRRRPEVSTCLTSQPGLCWRSRWPNLPSIRRPATGDQCVGWVQPTGRKTLCGGLHPPYDDAIAAARSIKAGAIVTSVPLAPTGRGVRGEGAGPTREGPSGASPSATARVSLGRTPAR